MGIVIACMVIIALGIIGLGIAFACVAIRSAHKCQEERQW